MARGDWSRASIGRDDERERRLLEAKQQRRADFVAQNKPALEAECARLTGLGFSPSEACRIVEMKHKELV